MNDTKDNVKRAQEITKRIETRNNIGIVIMTLVFAWVILTYIVMS